MEKNLKQVFPAARIIPRLIVEDELATELINLASRAYRGEKHEGSEEAVPLAAILAPAHAERAAAFFVSAKYYATSVPELRSLLSGKGSGGKLRRSISKLANLLEDADYQIPFVQMMALHSYGDPNFDSNSITSRENLEEYQCRLEKWKERLSPSVVRGTLLIWKQLMDDCHAQTKAAGASEKTAERNFVAQLGGYWRDELNAKPGNSRAEMPDGYRQVGLFPDFVRAAAKIIPAEYRPRSLDYAIRREVGRR